MDRTGYKEMNKRFIEEGEPPLILIFEFSNKLVREELKLKAKKIISDSEDEDIVVSEFEVENSKERGLVLINMNKTNTDFSDLAKIYKIVKDLEGYQNMIVSTVVPGQIMRLNR